MREGWSEGNAYGCGYIYDDFDVSSFFMANYFGCVFVYVNILVIFWFVSRAYLSDHFTVRVLKGLYC